MTWQDEAFIRASGEQFESSILDFSGPGMITLSFLYSQIFYDTKGLEDVLDRINHLPDEGKAKMIRILHYGFESLYLKASEKLANPDLIDEPPVV